jgi:hypothetical protein
MRSLYYIYCKEISNDNDTLPEKRLVVKKSRCSDRCLRLTTGITSLTINPPYLKAYDEGNCVLRINMKFCSKVLPAYPDIISLEDLAILFPATTSIILYMNKHFEYAELSCFRHLSHLNHIGESQKNINGIEYLTSLDKLFLRLKKSDDTKINLCHLNNLSLKKLALSDGKFILDNLFLPTLQSFSTVRTEIRMHNCILPEINNIWICESQIEIRNPVIPKIRDFSLIYCDVRSFEGNIDTPVLEKIVIGIDIYALLKCFRLNDLCTVKLLHGVNNREGYCQDVERFKSMFPNVQIETNEPE